VRPRGVLRVLDKYRRPHMTLDGIRPDDVYYDKKPEKPKRNSKTVPCHIDQHLFRETRITGYRLKSVA
jgi:hypothetical protein